MAASLAVRISFERSALSASLPLRCSSVDCLGTIFAATYTRSLLDGGQPRKIPMEYAYLLPGLHVLGDLHFPHTPRANRLSQSPLTSRSRDYRTTFRLTGTRGRRLRQLCGSGSIIGGRDGSRCGHIDAVPVMSRGGSVVLRSTRIGTVGRRRALLGAIPGAFPAD
jgi:hypothetical protein